MYGILTRLFSPLNQSESVTNTSEDCLTINVVRPAGLNSTAKLPVMVWIYGGGLIEGTSTLYNPAALVLQSMRMVCVLVIVTTRVLHVTICNSPI
jgi:acetylcholinesterase